MHQNNSNNNNKMPGNMPTIWATCQLLKLSFITWLFQECSSDQSSSHKSSSRGSPVSMGLRSVLPCSIPAINPPSPKPSRPPAIPWASCAPAALHSFCLEAWQACGCQPGQAPSVPITLWGHATRWLTSPKLSISKPPPKNSGVICTETGLKEQAGSFTLNAGFAFT